MNRIGFTLLVLLILSSTAWSQSDLKLQELKSDLNKASTPSQKVKAYFKLSEYYFLNQPSKSDSLALLGISTAESSRDQELMVIAYVEDASRFLQNNGQSENLAKATVHANKALAISKQSKDARLTVMCFNLFARIYRSTGETEKAIKSNNDAIALLPEVKDDSLKIAAYNSLGLSLRLKSDMLNSFKAFLNAFTIADQSGKASLIVSCNKELELFYLDIDNYEKAKDYAFRSLHTHENEKNRKLVMQDYYDIAIIYGHASDIPMGEFYFDKSEKLADSLHSDEFKINVRLGMINMYVNHNQFNKGYEILKNNPLIFDHFRKSGMQYEIDRASGYVQMMLKHYDSSFYYYKKAEPFYETKATPSQAFQFYWQYSLLYRELKQWNKAIECEEKAKVLAEHMGDLEALNGVIADLDSLHFHNNNFKEAYKYQMLHQQYSDSLRKLSEAKDILSLEIDDENKRTERAKVLEEEALARRHNLQYMGITAAIACVFIILIALGMFKVSATVVKATGFFAFIFLFEFITLILDTQIHHLTHGEPWKVLMIKIVLITMMLPLHHWLEEKVIHYLIQNRLLLTEKLGRLKFKKTPTAED